MAFTRAQLLAKVRLAVNEATAGFWSDNELEDYLSDGALDLSTKTGCVETTAAVVLSPNTIQYPAPITFTDPPLDGSVSLLKIHAALVGDEALSKIHPRMLSHVHDAEDGPPIHWAHWGTRLFFAPVGDGVTEGVLLLCSVSTDDVTDLPDAWQLLTVPYAAARAKQREGRTAEALVFYSDYLNSLTFQRNDLLERGVTSRAELTIPDDVEMPRG